MSYRLVFLESAKKEWDKLAPIIQNQFKKKLQEQVINPYIPKDKLIGVESCYKIKLKSVGYRLVYRVIEEKVIVQVVAIAKRDKNVVYELMRSRLSE